MHQPTIGETTYLFSNCDNKSFGYVEKCIVVQLIVDRDGTIKYIVKNSEGSNIPVGFRKSEGLYATESEAIAAAQACMNTEV